MKQSHIATHIIPHLAETSREALAVMLESADNDPFSVAATLPAGYGPRFKNASAARAKVAAKTVTTAEDQEPFVRDSRITVNRALARNPHLTVKNAGRLCQKAFRAGDTELLEAVLWRVDARDLFTHRDELFRAPEGRFHGLEARLADYVADRNDPEEVTAALSDQNPAMAGAMLARILNGRVACISFASALEKLKEPARALAAAQSEVQHFTMEFAAELAKHDVFDLVPRSHYWFWEQTPITFERGTPQVLMASSDKENVAISLASRRFDAVDIGFMLHAVLPELVRNAKTHYVQRNAQQQLEKFARRNADHLSATDMDALVKVFEATDASTPVFSSAWDAIVTALLPHAPSAQRVSMLPRCSSELIAGWLLGDGSRDVPDSVKPRPGEVLSVLSACSEDRLKSVALILGHRVLPNPAPKWWSEVADGLEGLFFQTPSVSFMAYAVKRLEEAIGDDQQAWRMVLQTWPNYHGSLSDFCLLAQLSMAEPRLDTVVENITAEDEDTASNTQLSLFA